MMMTMTMTMTRLLSIGIGLSLCGGALAQATGERMTGEQKSPRVTLVLQQEDGSLEVQLGSGEPVVRLGSERLADDRLRRTESGFEILDSVGKPVARVHLLDGGASITAVEQPPERAWLGVYLDTLEVPLAAYLDVEPTETCLVTRVIEGSPAAKAGLKANDVILGMNDIGHLSEGALRAVIHASQPGHMLRLRVMSRGQETRHVDITLEARPEAVASAGGAFALADGTMAGTAIPTLDQAFAQHGNRYARLDPGKNIYYGTSVEPSVVVQDGDGGERSLWLGGVPLLEDLPLVGGQFTYRVDPSAQGRSAQGRSAQGRSAQGRSAQGPSGGPFATYTPGASQGALAAQLAEIQVLLERIEKRLETLEASRTDGK